MSRRRKTNRRAYVREYDADEQLSRYLLFPDSYRRESETRSLGFWSQIEDRQEKSGGTGAQARSRGGLGKGALAAQIDRIANPPGENVVALKEVPA
jgi:hypothetical protein